MTNNKLTDPISFLSFIKPYVSPSGLISFEGVARCINLKPYDFMNSKTLDFKQYSLSHRLLNLNYHYKELYRYGFNFEAFLVVIDYYAFFKNGSATILLSTLKRFDAELELLKLVGINADKYRKENNHQSRVYLSYIDEIRNEGPDFMHNVSHLSKNSCFKTKDGSTPEKITNHLVSQDTLFFLLDAHLLLPANISLNGVADFLQVRPQVIASKQQEEIISKYLRFKLKFFGFDPPSLIKEGFPFVAFLLVLEHFAEIDNKAAKVALTTLESFDCELRIFYKLHKNGRGELKFLRERYFKEYRKINNEKLPEPHKTSIVYKYQKQLESYPYHTARPERLTDLQRLKYCSPERFSLIDVPNLLI